MELQLVFFASNCYNPSVKMTFIPGLSSKSSGQPQPLQSGRLRQRRDDIMKCETQQSGLVILNEMSKEEFAKVLAGLIKNDRGVQKAILNLAFSCPNFVNQI